MYRTQNFIIMKYVFYYLFIMFFYNRIHLLSFRGYVGIHSSGFRDFLLKPELLRAIVDSGFEHPSEGKALIFLFCFVF